MVAATLVAAGLSSCSLWGDDEPDCVSAEEYQDAQVAPTLSVPAGLDRPDSSVRLNVPDEPKQVEPLSQNAACLQRPPNYHAEPAAAPATK